MPLDESGIRSLVNLLDKMMLDRCIII